jgi:hypothetical protein
VADRAVHSGRRGTRPGEEVTVTAIDEDQELSVGSIDVTISLLDL